jgi:hypothetical protein
MPVMRRAAQTVIARVMTMMAKKAMMLTLNPQPSTPVAASPATREKLMVKPTKSRR